MSDVPQLDAEDLEQLRRRAARVGPRVSLEQVFLWSGECKRIRTDVPEGAALSAHVWVESGVVRTGDDVVVKIRYDVSATCEDEDFWKVNCEWGLLYTLTASEIDEIDDDDLEAFANVSGVFAAHPYVRSYVHKACGDMGVPVFVLDVVRSPLDASPVGIGQGAVPTAG